jgi:DNA polymerase-1
MYILRERSPFKIVDTNEGYEKITEVFVAHSPKAITKQHKLADDFLADFQFAFEPPPVTWIEPEVEIVNSQEAFLEWSRYQKVGMFSRPCAVDFETTGLHPMLHRPTTISMSWQPEYSLVVVLQDMSDEELACTLMDILKLLKMSKAVIYHEAKFDMKFYKKWCGHKPPLGWDTKIADYVMKGNPEASRGLKYLARRTMYAPVYDADIDFEGNTSIEDMAIYNGFDTSATYQLYLHQEGILANMCREDELLKHLLRITEMLVDVELCGARKAQLEHDIEGYQRQFDEDEELPNPDSPKQVKEFFGTTKADKEALGRVKNPIAKDILNYRGIKKELSTYVDGFIPHIVNGRIHSTYRPMGTLTGRLSSRQPNMQNLKSDEEEEHDYQAIVNSGEDSDKVIVHFDYSQIEARLIAVRAQCVRLIDLFLDGRSIHEELAIEIFGPDYSEKQYKRAKSTNFGIAYGISPYGLSRFIEIPEDEAAKYLETWYNMYPEVGKWQDKIRQEVRKNKVVRTNFGRSRYFGLEALVVSQGAIMREGINFPIQSEACDIHLLAALDIQTKAGIYPVQLVHDELVYELSKKGLDESIDYICWSMKKTAEDLTGNVIPFPAAVKE